MLQLRIANCLAALAIAAPALADDSITIDCNRGNTVGQVLADKALKNKALVLRVQGICVEHVLIDRDDVTLEGDAAGATITGSVTIDSGRHVVIANLTVTNATGDGVTVINGGSATIRDNNIVDNGGYGVALRNAAFALVNRNVLSRNGRTNPQASGIILGVGSTARGLDNVMEGNANAGIEVGDSSNYRSDGDVATASPSGRAGLDIYRAGFVDVRRVTVTGLVDLNQQSQLQVRNVAAGSDPGISTITGNIQVSGLSFLRLRSGVVHTGTRNCGSGPGFFAISASFYICAVDP